MNDQHPVAPGGDTIVYVELMGEGVDVQRPVLAARENDAFRLPPEAPEGETWSMPPGSLVRCEDRGGTLYAVGTL